MGRWAIAKIEWRKKWQWFAFRPCTYGCEHAHRVILGSTQRFNTWDEAVDHVRRQLNPPTGVIPPWTKRIKSDNPFYDTSKLTMIRSRFEASPFLVDEMKKMMRDVYGDLVADAIEMNMPPPYGTLGEKK